MTQPRVTWRHCVALLGPLALLVLAAVVWLGYRGVTVVGELQAARGDALALEASLRPQLSVGAHPAAASASADDSWSARVEAIGRHTAKARAATQDPVWRGVAALPFAGRNLAAVTSVAAASDTLARQALPELASVATTFQAVRAAPLRDGLPLTTLGRLAASLHRGADATDAARRTVAATPSGRLLGPVAQARGQLLSALTQLDAQLRPAADAADLAVPMLGGRGRRTYFVAFVNPAEIHGGGGLLGGYAVVRADAGKVQVAHIGSHSELRNLRQGPGGLPADFASNWGPYGGGTSWTESNLSAHFPYAGQAWAAMYAKLTGTHVDGTLSLDPTALSALLAGAPATRIGGTEVTSANVVSFLQRDEYALPLSDTARKAALRTVAGEAVQRLMRRPAAALPATLPPLARAAADGHVRLWSADPREQAVLSRHAIAGAVPVTTRPFLSVFVDNAASGKLDSYLSVTATYAVRTCSAPRRRSVVTVVLRNGAPSSGLPAYVTYRGDGAGEDGGRRPRKGANRSLVGVMLTDGAQVSSAKLDGVELGSQAGGDAAYLAQSIERGHQVASAFVDTDPGRSATLQLTVDEPASSQAPILLPQPMAIPQRLHAS